MEKHNPCCVPWLDWRPSIQELLLDGQPFRSHGYEKKQEQVVGVVFQDFQLFPHLSVFDNITLAPKMVFTTRQSYLLKKLLLWLKQLGLSRTFNAISPPTFRRATPTSSDCAGDGRWIRKYWRMMNLRVH